MVRKLNAMRRAHDEATKRAVERETLQTERIGQLQERCDKLEARLEEGRDSFKELRTDMSDLKVCVGRVDERTKNIQTLIEAGAGRE